MLRRWLRRWLGITDIPLYTVLLQQEVLMQQLETLKTNVAALQATQALVVAKIAELEAQAAQTVDPADVQAVADQVAAVDAALKAAIG